MEAKKKRTRRRHSRDKHRTHIPQHKTFSLSSIKYNKKQKDFDLKALKIKIEGQPPYQSRRERMFSGLYSKYCSSQNFFYTKEIDNILCGVKSRANVRFLEDLGYLSELERKEEMLKRYYKSNEYPKKTKLLSEYYKFHEDVPRLAMMPLSTVIHGYHDQKRRINYIKITKMLNNGKIDSEIVRNMDPNEDSDYSKGSIASSLLSFLPDEFKSPLLTQAKKKKSTPRSRMKKSKSSQKNPTFSRKRTKGRNVWNGADFRAKKCRTPTVNSPPEFYIGNLKKHKNGSGKNSMSTVKDLNSILSEIFAGNPMTNRSSIRSEICEFNPGSSPISMNWSADQSEILTQSQMRPKKEKIPEKRALVKKSVNKNILLTKFKPTNFLNGFRGNSKENKKNFGHLGIKAFNKKSREHQEIINNSRSPSGTMTKSFGLKSKSRRMSKLKNESNGSPANYKSNFSRSSCSKGGLPSQKKKNTLQLQNRFKIQVGKHSPTMHIRPRKMRLNISGKTGRFYNSNDHNHRQRTPNVTRKNTRQHDSYKKSLTSCFGTRDNQPKLDIINHKLKTYTRSQDCNQLNLNFKIKSKIEDYDPRFGGKRKSVKKKMRLNVFHEGINFRSCKQNIWKNRPIQMDLKKIQKNQMNRMTETQPRDSSNEEAESFPERRRMMYNQKMRKPEAVDFEHPIFSSHNTNSHKDIVNRSQWTMYNGAWKSTPEEENLYTIKSTTGTENSHPIRSSPKKRLSCNNDLNQILKSLQNMKDSQKKRLREQARKSKNSNNFNKTRGSFKTNGQSRGSQKPQKYSLKKKENAKMDLKVGVKAGRELGMRRPKAGREMGNLRDLKVMDHLMFDSKNWMERLDGLKQLNGCNININNNFININTLQQKEKGLENALYQDKRETNKGNNYEFHKQTQKTYEEKPKNECAAKKKSFSSPQGPPKKKTIWELNKPKKHSKGSLPQRNRAKTQKENSYFGAKKSKHVRTSPDQNKKSWKNFKSPKIEKLRRGQKGLDNFNTGKKDVSKEMRKGSRIKMRKKNKESRSKKQKKKYQSSKNIVRSNPKKKMRRKDRPKNFSSKAEYASLKKTGRQLGPLDFRSYTNKENRRVPISCKNKGINFDRESKTTLLGLFLQKKCENLEHLLKSKITKAKRERLENVFRKENSQISTAHDILAKKSSVLGKFNHNTLDRRHSTNDANGSLEGPKIRFNKPSIKCIGSIDNNINSLQKMNVRPTEELSSKSRIRLMDGSNAESPFNFKRRIENGSKSQKESVIRSQKVVSPGLEGHFNSGEGNFQAWTGKLKNPQGFEMMGNVTSNLILAKMRKENQMIQRRDKKADIKQRAGNLKKTGNRRKQGHFTTNGRTKDRVSGLKRRKSKNSNQASSHQRSKNEADIFQKLFSNKFSEQERRLKLRSINELDDFRNSRSIKNSIRTGKQGNQKIFQKKISLPEKANRESFRLFKSKVTAQMRNEKSIRERKSLKYENNLKKYPTGHLAIVQK